ncbi:MAG: hypothetical protein Q9169_007762 [Polycauliona sp. 2 TL-2023]
MRVSLLYAASSFFALIAAQQPEGPNPFTLPPGFMINAGERTTITWTPTTGGTVSIRLRQGASSNLEEGTVIACEQFLFPILSIGARVLTSLVADIQNNGRAEITLPEDTTRNSDYALQIVSGPGEDDSNYSAQFVVESDNTVESISSAPSSAAATSAASMTSEDASTTTDSSSMTTSGASTRTSMSTRTGSSSMTRSTGSPSATSEESSPTGESAEDPVVPSSGANSLTAGGLFLAAVVGLAAIW